MFNEENIRCMNVEQLGLRMRKIREMLNLSQLQVAEKLGVTQTYIWRLENGSAKADFLIRAMEFYNQYISLDRLMNEKMSILECIEKELASPTSELVKKRAVLVRVMMNELFETFRQEQNVHIDKLVKRFNVKMDALDDE